MPYLRIAREWTALCSKVLDDADLADDPRFHSNPQRLQNRDVLEALIERHFASFTAEQVIRRLDEAAIANAHMNTVEDFLRHPQLHERDRVRKVGSPNGPLTSFLPAITIPGTEPVMGDIPAVGAHTEAILAELGLKETI